MARRRKQVNEQELRARIRAEERLRAQYAQLYDKASELISNADGASEFRPRGLRLFIMASAALLGSMAGIEQDLGLKERLSQSFSRMVSRIVARHTISNREIDPSSVRHIMGSFPHQVVGGMDPLPQHRGTVNSTQQGLVGSALRGIAPTMYVNRGYGKYTNLPSPADLEGRYPGMYSKLEEAYQEAMEDWTPSQKVAAAIGAAGTTGIIGLAALKGIRRFKMARSAPRPVAVHEVSPRPVAVHEVQVSPLFSAEKEVAAREAREVAARLAEEGRHAWRNIPWTGDEAVRQANQYGIGIARRSAYTRRKALTRGLLPVFKRDPELASIRQQKASALKQQRQEKLQQSLKDKEMQAYREDRWKKDKYWTAMNRHINRLSRDAERAGNTEAEEALEKLHDQLVIATKGSAQTMEEFWDKHFPGQGIPIVKESVASSRAIYDRFKCNRHRGEGGQ